MINLDNLLNLDAAIRYAAFYLNGVVEMQSKDSVPNQSSSETDKYEELLVNPTLLGLAERRGDLDCGGLDYLLVAYGNFFQYVQRIGQGHVSVCISKESDTMKIAAKIRIWLRTTAIQER